MSTSREGRWELRYTLPPEHEGPIRAQPTERCPKLALPSGPWSASTVAAVLQELERQRIEAARRFGEAENPAAN